MARKLKEDSQKEVVEDGTAAAEVRAKNDAEQEGASDTKVEESNNESQRLECGAKLRSARIAQDLSTQAVAKQLRLSNKQIDALEQDDFAALPEPTIVKGFIRNYAKLLKIPADTMLIAYAEMTPDAVPCAMVLNSGINKKITEKKTKSGGSGYLLFALLFLFGLGAWFFYQSYIQKPEITNTVAYISGVLPTLDLPTRESELEEALPAALAASPEAQLTESDNAQSVASEITSVETATVASTSDKAIVAAQASAQLVDEKEAPAVVGKTRLEFNATQETWLNVVNQSGEEVYNKILYAGNRDVIDVSQPLEIVVGNAHGATLVVDGNPIDLAPYTRANVARVRLNQ
ncbi:MAG: cytoskeleton protein RodZ [Methylophilaceae bacterium]|jgi:cytoskeleton protein RodZ